jgi:type IV pilus assembly protein PilA
MIELLVVIIIIGILAAIAIPLFLNQRQKAYDASVKADLNAASIAEESYLTNSQTSYTSVGNLTSGNLIPQHASPGDAIAVNYNAGQGFCLIGSNVNHPNVYWVYDSQAGGLQTTSYTTSTAATNSCTAADVGSAVTYWYGVGGS